MVTRIALAFAAFASSAPAWAQDGTAVPEGSHLTLFALGLIGVIAAILAVITAAEVTLSYVDVGWIFLPALLIMMVAKFVTVVSYFMHLKFDNKIFTFAFYTGLLLAIFVYVVALATFHFFGS